jgi:hypothetical protein
MTGFREQEIMYLFWTDVNLAIADRSRDR